MGEPRYQIEDIVNEIIGRRDQAIQDMSDELKGLLTGLVDQFSAMKKWDSRIDLKTIRFTRKRWINDYGRSVLVFDLEHNGQPLLPQDVRMW